MDPAGAQIGAQDFSAGLNGERMMVSPEVDLPSLTAENVMLHLPRSGKAGQQPKADRFVALGRGDNESEPGFFQAAELAKGGDDDGAVAAGGFVWAVIGGHLGKHETG